jgi:glyoxylase-like metal-dependent hydrolase (beta-lactamase superfamily II)
VTTERNLVELGQGVFAWVHPDPSFGDTNVGLVIDGDGLTVIDTTATPTEAAAVRHEIETLTAELELPLKRVVLSSSRVAFAGGSTAFWQAAFYGTEAISDQLDTPANPDALRRLLPNRARAYDEGFATRPVTHTVDEPAWLTGAAFGVPLPGEGPDNLAVVVEGAGLVFAGALASFGVTPLAFDGDPMAWIQSLDQLATMGTTIIPGHGPPGGSADAEDLIDYLRACIDADGDPDRLKPGPWDGWTDRRFDAINVERAALLAVGDTSVPRSMLALLGLG